MANPFGIQEVTLAQISDKDHAINGVDLTGGVSSTPRKSVYQPVVCIVTDHADAKTPSWPDNTGSAADEAELLRTAAIFKSKHHGQPWLKDQALVHKIHPVAGATAAPIASGNDFSVIFPDFDYSTFE